MIGAMEEFRGLHASFPLKGGLRLGVMWDLPLEKATRKIAVNNPSRNAWRRFSCDPETAEKVMQHALAIFRQLKPKTDAYTDLTSLELRPCTKWGCLSLRPTTTSMAPYLVENADLARFYHPRTKK